LIDLPVLPNPKSESTTTRIAGGLDFTAIGGKGVGRSAPIVEKNAAEAGAKHPAWKAQLTLSPYFKLSVPSTLSCNRFIGYYH
jgi:hypothetical protein